MSKDLTTDELIKKILEKARKLAADESAGWRAARAEAERRLKSERELNEAIKSLDDERLRTC